VSRDDSTAKTPKMASFLLTALLSPLQAEISAIVVEYGLYEGRFWLPRIQSMEGVATAMFARVPIKYENAFKEATKAVSAALAVTQTALASSTRTQIVELAAKYRLPAIYARREFC